MGARRLRLPGGKAIGTDKSGQIEWPGVAVVTLDRRPVDGQTSGRIRFRREDARPGERTTRWDCVDGRARSRASGQWRFASV
jgi:hypothetical protein